MAVEQWHTCRYHVRSRCGKWPVKSALVQQFSPKKDWHFVQVCLELLASPVGVLLSQRLLNL